MNLIARSASISSLLFVACPAGLVAQSPQEVILRRELLDLIEKPRQIDGSDNNRRNSEWGSAGTPFVRWTTAAYTGGHQPPRGHAASARSISNLVCAQSLPIPNAAGASDFVWQWGQFLDHDLDETPVLSPAEPFDIAVPAGDAHFDPTGTGTATISLDRSFYEFEHGNRQQVNEITAFIDASQVYGSDSVRAAALRTLDGTGRLRTSANGQFLPYNDRGLPNAPSSAPSFFLAGDLRANEQVGLTAMHTLFVREHNWWTDRIRRVLPAESGTPSEGRDERRRRTRGGGTRQLSGDDIYEMARAIVAAEMQAITYREFLPVLLGPNALPPYRGYRRDVNPTIANEFATASYRFGHSMLSPVLMRLDGRGQEIPEGHLPLLAAFFDPSQVTSVGIEPYLRGLATQRAQEIDNHIIDDVRNFLFGAPGSGGFDLAALNIQRGRDHGLPGYNQLRRDLGLRPVATFAEVSRSTEVQNALAAAYASVEDIDPWLGGLAEDHVRGALVGETIHTVLARQFAALRDGDRYWYQHTLAPDLQRMIERQTLAEIIRRNTAIGRELPRDIWHAGRQANWQKAHERLREIRRLRGRRRGR